MGQAKTLHEITLRGTVPPRVIGAPSEQLRDFGRGTKNFTTDWVGVRLAQ
jgi:hypothetical protein